MKITYDFKLMVFELLCPRKVNICCRVQSVRIEMMCTDKTDGEVNHLPQEFNYRRSTLTFLRTRVISRTIV